MAAIRSTTAAAVASTAIRICSYLFLRWAAIPQFLPVVYALFAIYVPTFIRGYLAEEEDVVVDEVDVAIKDHPQDTAEIADEETDKAVAAESVEVRETVAVSRRPSNPLSAFLKGTPNPRSLLLSAATFLINVACLAMVTDAIYSPRWFHPSHDLSFARVGYVSDIQAKLLLREPDQSKMPITVQIHLKDAKAPFDNPLWQIAGQVRNTSEEVDYTAVVDIPLMHSAQRVYEWTTSNNHSGEFTSAPKPGSMPKLFDGKFTFLSSSCILPRLPYSPLDHPLSVPGMKHLGKVLPTLGAQFMLFLGDFIYIEVPRQFGSSVESYRQKYRQVYASPDWPAVGQNLSWIHVLDDHEISNDWDSKSAGVYETAVDPWHHYQTAVNPPLAPRAGTFSLLPRPRATYFAFAQGPASFFMLDTRSYRSKNSEPFESANKTMLGETQLQDFTEWLRKPEAEGVKWKVVASSVPFTKNWRVNTRDTWGGFLAERQKILEAMWDASNLGVGVIILSGDRHEFGATAFPPPKGSKWPESATVHEFSASPLNQFYSPIPTYKQTDEEDVELKYMNTGNSKFGAITIEKMADVDRSTLEYTIFIDGVAKWNTTILSPPPLHPAGLSGSLWDRLRGIYNGL